MSKLKVYKASAGSGKTYTLALEYIKELLLKKSAYSHRQILAVTFTKDATGEMKDRILAELYGLAFHCNDSGTFLKSVQDALAKENNAMEEDKIRRKAKDILQNILHDYSRLHITTIDSFFQKVLRNLARELGKGSRFNLEMNSSKVLAEAVRSMYENANDNPQLLDWLTTYIEEKLEEGANWRIEQEIFEFSKCIFNEHFQEHEYELKKQLDNNPEIFEQIRKQHSRVQKECREFFQKAQSEILKIIDQYKLELTDFSQKATVISFFRKLSEGDFSKADINKTIEACRTDPEKWTTAKNPRKSEIVMLATINFIPLLNQAIEIFKKYNTSGMILQNLHQLGLIWDITNEISEQNAENNRFMLADTALFLNKMIDDSDAPFIYEKIGAEIKHVMIDEFQDTSRLQWKNFKSLLSEILAHNSFSLIVGDVKQSIYRWRNGDWNILNNIREELHAREEVLDFNFRSQPQIVEFNNHFFTHAAELLNEKYGFCFENISRSPFPSTYSQKDLFQTPNKKGDLGFVSIDLIPGKSEDAEYEELVLKNVLEQIRNLSHCGIAANEICILTRTNDNIIDIAEYLSSQKEAEPELAAGRYLNIVSNEAFQLNSSPSIRIIIEALRILAQPENPIPHAQLQFLLNKWVPGSTIISILPDPDSEAFRQLTTQPLLELIGNLYRIFGLDRIDGQSNYMFSFYDAVNAYLNDFPADIHSFLKYWSDELQRKTVPSGTSVRGIRAMTIHKAKGLQFHTVIVPFCDWSIYPKLNPIVWCDSKEGLYDLKLLPVRYTGKMQNTEFTDEYENETGQSWMDNLNLLYVAFTRPEQNLIIIARQKNKLESADDIKTVSDLLQFSMPNLNGSLLEDNTRFEKGIMDNPEPEKKKDTDNLLKMSPNPLPIAFISQDFNKEKSIFKQSNKSREFINEEVAAKNQYIAHGNVMHAIFSHIETLDDIEKAVDKICMEGIIPDSEKTVYSGKIKKAIQDTGSEQWFSGNYTIYNECSVIIKEKDEITTLRPDRVLINNTETVIIDYKFGEQHAAHKKQMKTYESLMKQMNYPNISSYLWYVEENKIVSLSD